MSNSQASTEIHPCEKLLKNHGASAKTKIIEYHLYIQFLNLFHKYVERIFAKSTTKLLSIHFLMFTLCQRLDA